MAYQPHPRLRSCLGVVCCIMGIGAASVCTPLVWAQSSEAARETLEQRWDLEDWLGILGGAIGLTTLGIGVYQYSQAEKWKRAEFVANKIDEFEADPAVQRVLTMLDWNARTLHYPNGQAIKVDDIVLCNALAIPAGHAHFSDAEALVRDDFSEFLDWLERFETFIQAGLVKVQEFQPYLDYWLNILGNPHSGRKAIAFYTALSEFLNTYSYARTRQLLSRYGYPIDPPPPSSPPPPNPKRLRRSAP